MRTRESEAERLRRYRWEHPEYKLRELKLSRRRREGITVCGFCRAKRARGFVGRLKISGEGFVAVRVPYCGVC